LDRDLLRGDHETDAGKYFYCEKCRIDLNDESGRGMFWRVLSMWFGVSVLRNFSPLGRWRLTLSIPSHPGRSGVA